ncbi:MarR family transcriptional regulator [Rouxiella sp. S1S-2]|uniref:MarR family winged helix-turn-helix transcriptional regulator n=1 Tax=Rouxiella sp. S1S-2 TaxID=2653856 RepID=UPI001264134B|nr:MarR family transcriptional regulator [Rouxiella sp. S1S-2]KAB7896376.1 MarR family transcriptional regulator [Rouxiella sp. S1S-2]
MKKSQYEALSEFRYQLRRFLHFSEEVAKKEELTPLQYLLMLHVEGFPGRSWATVGEIAERLQMKHHGTVALLTRCELLGLIERKKSTTDRRRVEVHLLEEGKLRLSRLAALHEAELLSLKDVFSVHQITAFNDETLPAQDGLG